MGNDVPYIVHEAQCARLERIIKRLVTIILVLITILVVSNLSWICYENSFEEVVYTTTIEAVQDSADGGTNTIIGGFYDAEADREDYTERQDSQEEKQ